MPFARQTLGNRLKAIVNLNLRRFCPGRNLEHWDHGKDFPIQLAERETTLRERIKI
jgi:hypothetical protein